MRSFLDTDRFDFNLTPDSLVIDGGCYRGQWARAISEKYRCHIHSFEPCTKWYEEAGRVLKEYPKVTLLNAGLGASMRKVDFGVQNDSTGMFAKGMPQEGGTFEHETVQIIDGVAYVRSLGQKVDLLKLNIEGSEFEFLEHVLAEDAASLFRTIIVQPHMNAPNYEFRWRRIQERLSHTHELVAAVLFVWEKWEIRA